MLKQGRQRERERGSHDGDQKPGWLSVTVRPAREGGHGHRPEDGDPRSGMPTLSAIHSEQLVGNSVPPNLHSAPGEVEKIGAIKPRPASGHLRSQLSEETGQTRVCFSSQRWPSPACERTCTSDVCKRGTGLEVSVTQEHQGEPLA